MFIYKNFFNIIFSILFNLLTQKSRLRDRNENYAKQEEQEDVIFAKRYHLKFDKKHLANY